MKRIFTLMLSMILVISMLTGCSPAEIGLANLVKDLSNEKMMKVSGEYEIEAPEEIKISYSGDIDISSKDNPYVNIKFNLDYPGEKVHIENGNLVVNNKNIYISKNIVREILKTEETENYINSFDNSLEDIEYFYVENEEAEDFEMMTEYYAMTEDLISDELITEFKEIFKYFQTDFVKKENNLYVVEIDKYSIFQTVDNFMNFLDKHKEKIYDSLSAAVINNYNIIQTLTQGELPEKDELLIEIKETRADFISEIENTVKDYKESFREELRKELAELEDTKITQTFIKRKDNEYISTQNVKIVYKTYVSLGENLDGMGLKRNTILFNGKTKIDIVDAIERVMPKNALDIIDAQDTVEKTYNFNYPVKQIDIIWDDVQYGGRIQKTNTDQQVTYSHYDLLTIDDVLYIPLRQTAEDLGRTVYWDNETQKAYVLNNNNEKIDMTGIIHDSRTFVKTEDFKKLDYRLYYDFDGISKITTIVEKSFDNRG